MKKVFAFGLDLEVEDWVKFLAVDDDGSIYGYKLKPREGASTWKCSGHFDDFVYLSEMDLNGSSHHLLIVGV